MSCSSVDTSLVSSSEFYAESRQAQLPVTAGPAFWPGSPRHESGIAYNAAVAEQDHDAPRMHGQEALDAVWPEVYQELRRLAGYYVRGERPDLTLQPTALVHEAYVRLQRDWALARAWLRRRLAPGTPP
jgi:hypothetical protein